MTGERITNIRNLSAAYSLVFGAYIAQPYTDLFHTSGALYAPMTFMVDSEPFWGGLMIAASLACWGLSYRGSARGSVVMAAVFCFFSVLFFIGDPERPGGALFFILAAFNAVQYKAVLWKESHSQAG